MKRFIEGSLSVLGLISLVGLTSCGMFYSKVGDRPGATPSQSGKVSVADVAVTEYSFSETDQTESGAQYVPLDTPLSFSMTIDQAPNSSAIGFGQEFTLAGKADFGQKQQVTGRVMFAPSNNPKAPGKVASVVLSATGIEIANAACQKKEGVSDTGAELPETTPDKVGDSFAIGVDVVTTYICPLAGNWQAGTAYKVGVVNTTADGVVIKINGEGFEGDKGYLKLAGLKGMQLGTSVKAFTRALKAFGTCDALPQSNATFGSPILGGKQGKAVSSGDPIPACSEAIAITCTPAGCRHVVNSGL